tara:strand:+ start:282 stop:521 length:240 start_codon:yes stop_codon:yes gene_type:complete
MEIQCKRYKTWLYSQQLVDFFTLVRTARIMDLSRSLDFIEHDNSWKKKTSSDHFNIFRFPVYLLADSRERTGHHNTNLK